MTVVYNRLQQNASGAMAACVLLLTGRLASRLCTDMHE